jgi:hypothetical protein
VATLKGQKEAEIVKMFNVSKRILFQNGKIDFW